MLTKVISDVILTLYITIEHIVETFGHYTLCFSIENFTITQYTTRWLFNYDLPHCKQSFEFKFYSLSKQKVLNFILLFGRAFLIKKLLVFIGYQII